MARTSAATLEARGVTLGYGGAHAAPIVRDVSLAFPPGRISVIVGANGCGKSTLLRGLSRLLRPMTGEVLLDGEDVHAMAPRALAQRLALLPQSPTAPSDITVRQLVEFGRHPYRGLLSRGDQDDRAAVAAALEATGLEPLADRPVAELSGGQRQRAWIAMSLAQQTDVLLLDEPTTYLDLAHQLDVLQTVWDLNAREGTTVVMVLHDLNLAARYGHHLVAMKDGRVLAEGAPAEVVTEETMRAVFGVETVVMPDPIARTPMVVPRAGAAAVLLRGGDEPIEADELDAVEPRATVARPDAAVGTMAQTSPTLAFAARVEAITDVGPGLRRLTLGGDDLAHFGVDGDLLDLRFKLAVPDAGATDASIGEVLAPLRPGAPAEAGAADGWYQRWLAEPTGRRGVMRTYTVRDIRAGADGPLLDVDLVLHGIDADGRPGPDAGPAAAFAAAAQVGDPIHLVGPNVHLCDTDYGGIDFRPGDSRSLLIAGDETAAPAICAILRDLPADATGDAVIEVPGPGHVQEVDGPEGVRVSWLLRGRGQAHGLLLDAAVRRVAAGWASALPEVRERAESDAAAGSEPVELDPVDIDQGILWETGSGEFRDGYAWIAGEAGVVKGLRRHLVADLGVDRRRIAFMGYWRQGRAGL